MGTDGEQPPTTEQVIADASAKSPKMHAVRAMLSSGMLRRLDEHVDLEGGSRSMTICAALELYLQPGLTAARLMDRLTLVETRLSIVEAKIANK